LTHGGNQLVLRPSHNPGHSMTLTVNGRTADHPIDPLFLERWSPRA